MDRIDRRILLSCVSLTLAIGLCLSLVCLAWAVLWLISS
jgi:hypothetical protein